MRNYLLIDDDKVFNFIHTEVIRKVDSTGQIAVFHSGEEGLNHLETAEKGSERIPDLIFLDIRMPGMGGFEVLKKLQDFAPTVFGKAWIYLLTASQDEHHMQEASQYKAVKGFLKKPLTTEELKRILQENNDL